MSNLSKFFRRAANAFFAQKNTHAGSHFTKLLMDKLAHRYLEIIEKNDTNFEHKEHLVRMLKSILVNADKLPSDKLNRWIGFVQGILFAQNMISIDEEREITRPWFHQFYRDTKQDIPCSIDVRDQ